MQFYATKIVGRFCCNIIYIFHDKALRVGSLELDLCKRHVNVEAIQSPLLGIYLGAFWWARCNEIFLQ